MYPMNSRNFQLDIILNFNGVGDEDSNASIFAKPNIVWQR